MRYLLNATCGVLLLLGTAVVGLAIRSEVRRDQLFLAFNRRLWLIESDSSEATFNGLRFVAAYQWPARGQIGLSAVSHDKDERRYLSLPYSEYSSHSLRLWGVRRGYGDLRIAFSDDLRPLTGDELMANRGSTDDRLLPFSDVILPHWLSALGLFAIPVVRVWTVTYLRARRYAHTASGRCVTCGYDLTGNVSGVCPECGEKR